MRAGGGSIILVSSCSAKLGYMGLTDYCATKGGVEAMVRSLACDAGPQVRVNALAPGTTKTPMTRGLWEDPRKQAAHASPGRPPCDPATFRALWITHADLPLFRSP